MNILNKINLRIFLWATFTGGAISSLVKSGTEANMPPRIAGEVSPPALNIDAWLGSLGFSSHSLDYVYQGVTVPGAVMLYHWMFSFIFAGLYVLASAFLPRIRLWYGAAYGIVITLVMHGLLIPALGFRHPAYLNGQTGWLWNLNGYEFWSELLGHICWSVSIEVSLIAVLAMFSRPLQGMWVTGSSQS
ncbi:YagU family protein [Yokenella regensburgei]|uniref:YagU family protein n=3 Tax=Yokenella regensburgei TaxID=158877 RepID=UPI003ED9AA01